MSEPVFHPISYEAFLADLEAVARAIEQTTWRPDYLVGIGRGGLVPAAFLSHRLGLAMLSVDHSSKVHDFADALLEKVAGRIGQGEHILFVDDINDSGATITHLRDQIARHCEPMDRCRVAVLIDNVRSMASVDFFARRIDRAVTKDWFVFPWESVATRAALLGDAAEVPGRIA
jgi:hypoxanthine phosphoribosyltransferase